MARKSQPELKGRKAYHCQNILSQIWETTLQYAHIHSRQYTFFQGNTVLTQGHQQEINRELEPRDNEERVERNNGVLSRLTQVFDRHRQPSRESPRVPSSSRPKRSLFLALKRSMPNLRRSSNRQQFQELSDVPQPPTMPRSGDFSDNNGQVENHPELLLAGSLRRSSASTGRATARAPKSVASTAATVEFSVGARKPDAGGMMETWLSMIIRAEVHNLDDALQRAPNSPQSALDILILVDNT